jgi:hypothetical protein
VADTDNVFDLGNVTRVDEYDGPTPDGLDGGTPDEISTDTPPRKVRTCEVCGTELQYAGRGKPPKYCPEHRKQGNTGTGRRTPSGNTKADREAKELGTRLDGQIVKVAMMVAPFDVYDGMTLAVMRKPVVEQYEGVMRTHDEWRALMLKTQANGSVIGLAVAVAMMLAPVMAHHHMIPEKLGKIPVGQALQSLPSIMARMEKAAQAGDEVLSEYMARMGEQEKARKQAAQPSAGDNAA